MPGNPLFLCDILPLTFCRYIPPELPFCIRIKFLSAISGCNLTSLSLRLCTISLTHAMTPLLTKFGWSSTCLSSLRGKRVKLSMFWFPVIFP
ncbi:hypothetical protein D3C76_1539650 [compost metagenome]